MNKYIHYAGTSYDNMKQSLLPYIYEEHIIDFLKLLSDYPFLLDKDEKYSQVTEQYTSNSYNKLVPTTTYFINIKSFLYTLNRSND